MGKKEVRQTGSSESGPSECCADPFLTEVRTKQHGARVVK